MGKQLDLFAPADDAERGPEHCAGVRLERIGMGYGHCWVCGRCVRVDAWSAEWIAAHTPKKKRRRAA